MQTAMLGYRLGDSRDEELCRVEWGCFPLAYTLCPCILYTREYTLCQTTAGHLSPSSSGPVG